MNKKKLFVITALIVLLAILGTGTLAYFTTRTVAHNVITSGGVKIQLVEDFPGSVNKPGVENTKVKDGVMPGQVVDKTVKVRNLDEPAWIRVKVEVTCEGDPVDPRILSIDYNLGNGANQWTRGDASKGEGNIYYYNSIVNAPNNTNSDETSLLFTEVSFSGENMGNEYQSAEISVAVKAQAVQAKNNPIPDGGKVTDIAGWPNF